MAEESLTVNVDLQTKEDIVANTCCEEMSSDDQSDNSSLSSYGLKLLEEPSSDQSVESSCSSTRRNSLQSNSDYGFNLLFGSSGASSASIGTPLQSRNTSDILGGIDLLLHRLTSERFLELRRIQLGQRPVTGTNARENLESFFHRAVHGLTNEEQLQLHEENRPENVANDVESLLQQGVVRSALQNDFRQHLERSLASRVSPSVQPTSIRRTQSASTSSTANNQSTSVSSNPFRARLERLLSSRIPTHGSNSQNLRSQRTHESSSLHRRRNEASIPISTNRNNDAVSNHNNTVPRINEGRYTTNTNNTTPSGRTNNLQITIESGMQLLTESITEDLTRLQSLQVVSNMLSSDFRNDLEERIHERVSTVGNGENVQNFVRSLPRHTRPLETRRNFQANFIGGTSSEVENLQRQLAEMKRMMAMSIEIQMDTQRTIRQEVSAVFASFMEQYAQSQNDTATLPRHPTVLYPQRNTPPASVGQCVICIDRSIDSVLYQCGHMCVCNQCGLQLKIDGHHCPMCRAPIRDVIRAYQAQ